MKKMVFVAINLPPETKEELANLLKQLKKINSQPVVRYVKTKGIHLTLHFLGYLTEQEIDQVKEVIKRLAKNYQSTVLLTGKIDAFPNLNQPRVIFLSSHQKAGESLINLQQDLAENLEKIGLTIDHRNWQPHLTLARIVGPCQFKTEQVKLPSLEIPVKSIELM